MHLVALILFLCLLPKDLLFAQTSENNKELILSNHVSFYKNNYRVSSVPQLSLTNGKRSLAAGPTILVYSKVGYQTMPKFTGIKATYRFIKDNEKNLSFYIGNDLILQRISDQWVAVAFDETLGQYKNYKYSNTEILLENNIGYGLKFNISKHLHLSQGVGAGFYISNLHGKPLDKDAPLNINSDYRGYKNFGVTWNVQLGIGISL